MNEPTAGLCVRDLCKDYPTPAATLLVLRGVSLTLSAGESMAIVGPSGSGKSTLLNIIAGLDAPTSGSVRLDGVDPFALTEAELAAFRGRSVGFVFQEHHLLSQCTAQENLLVAAMAAGPVRDEHVRRAVELLDRVGLADRAGHVPAELSGGERQRVAVARAMMNRPALLLCDEPTGNLDSHASETVTDLLLSMAAEAGAIVLAVTHAAAVAERLDHRRRLVDGVLVEA